jgi:hypothetical protein
LAGRHYQAELGNELTDNYADMAIALSVYRGYLLCAHYKNNNIIKNFLL